ncbi:MAG: TfoX/Sxy family protein [Planctomycetaceae bacterium]|nr:TfoX/Sxy family protein [Planctomycetaceae bacterium]
MAYSLALADRIRQLVSRHNGVVEKKMFGGIGFLLNGNMCVGVWQESLIARIGPARYTHALQQPYVREFDITGRAMTGWVMIAPEGLENNDQLQRWISRSMQFTGTLPAK